MDVQAALNTVGTDGTRLGDELARIGYAGDMAPGRHRAAASTSNCTSSRGPVLEAEGKLIGVVESLQGHLLAEGDHHRCGQPRRYHAHAAAAMPATQLRRA